MSQSEVAQLLKQIEQEYQASKVGLEGFASGTARHDFLQKRTENIGRCHEQLTTLIGAEQAITMIASTLWTPIEQGSTQ